jgi:hypothetical protein
LKDVLSAAICLAALDGGSRRQVSRLCEEIDERMQVRYVGANPTFECLLAAISF